MTTTNLTVTTESAITDFVRIRKACAIKVAASNGYSGTIKKNLDVFKSVTAPSDFKIVFAVAKIFNILATSNILARLVQSLSKLVRVENTPSLSVIPNLAKLLTITCTPNKAIIKQPLVIISTSTLAVLKIIFSSAVSLLVLVNYNVFRKLNISKFPAISSLGNISVVKESTKTIALTSTPNLAIKKSISKQLIAYSTNLCKAIISFVMLLTIISQTYIRLLAGLSWHYLLNIQSPSNILLQLQINPIFKVESPILLELVKLPEKILSRSSPTLATLAKQFSFASAIAVTSQLYGIVSKVLSLRYITSVISETVTTADLVSAIRQAYTMTISLIVTPTITADLSSTLLQHLTYTLTVTSQVSIGLYKTMFKELAATTQSILDMLRSWG